jgi:ribonuclease Z
MNRLTVLGSAFAVANRNQENAYLLVQTRSNIVLIDCGNNPVGKLEQVGVAINQITDLILTHAHADHMGALPLLLMDMWLNKRQTTLKIYGLAYTLEKAKTLLAIYNWESWQGMFPVDFLTVSAETKQEIIHAKELSISVAPVKHLVPTVGVRISFVEIHKTFVYSCDTEPCKGLDQLATGADLLIQEAAGPAKGHTSPEEAGDIANKAGVKELVLIHYDAGRTEADLLSRASSKFTGKVSLAKDLLFFE